MDYSEAHISGGPEDYARYLRYHTTRRLPSPNVESYQTYPDYLQVLRVLKHGISKLTSQPRMPNRTGKSRSFTSLPLPEVDVAPAEIAYDAEELHNDDFTLKSNYHGIYMGDARLEPIFEELNERNAKVFFHPTTGYSYTNGEPLPFKPLPYSSPLMEFFASACEVVSQILSGTASLYPSITFMIPHSSTASATSPIRPSSQTSTSRSKTCVVSYRGDEIATLVSTRSWRL